VSERIRLLCGGILNPVPSMANPQNERPQAPEEDSMTIPMPGGEAEAQAKDAEAAVVAKLDTYSPRPEFFSPTPYNPNSKPSTIKPQSLNHPP